MEVDEKFLNVIYYISTYMIFLLPFADFHHMSEVSLTIQTMANLTKRVLDLLSLIPSTRHCSLEPMADLPELLGLK